MFKLKIGTLLVNKLPYRWASGTNMSYGDLGLLTDIKHDDSGCTTTKILFKETLLVNIWDSKRHFDLYWEITDDSSS